MVACYLELYEEGEVEHINGPTVDYYGYKRSIGGCYCGYFIIFEL